MPYQGDRDESLRVKFTTDIKYLTKFPGVFILIQLLCCGLGFLVSLGSSFVWHGRGGIAFFIMVSFVASTGCLVWLVIHVFQLYSLCKKDINWNLTGLVFNGVIGFFVMVASCIMIETASSARPLRAAGVFGFFGFTGCLMGLAWEVTVWLKNRDSGLSFATATVEQGPRRPDSMSSSNDDNVTDALALQTDSNEESGIGFKGMKNRPVSSFIQEPNQMGGVTTPMLYAPGNDDSKSGTRSLSSGGHSQNSEDSSKECSVFGELKLYPPPTA
ncbi:hypothetical protein SK128_027928 [Halocaridina rubra]|uniref:MARVEL domain-containing protein n=1 Tax=Halocaridina rubra TaxID=373956 RepID=A0AAN8WMC6_HALRR